MSTYLLAFVISDFEFINGVHTGNNVTFRIWSRSEALNQTKYAAEIGPKILQYYEDYFNVALPLPKQVGWKFEFQVAGWASKISKVEKILKGSLD